MLRRAEPGAHGLVGVSRGVFRDRDELVRQPDLGPSPFQLKLRDRREETLARGECALRFPLTAEVAMRRPSWEKAMWLTPVWWAVERLNWHT